MLSVHDSSHVADEQGLDGTCVLEICHPLRVELFTSPWAQHTQALEG